MTLKHLTTEELIRRGSEPIHDPDTGKVIGYDPVLTEAEREEGLKDMRETFARLERIHDARKAHEAAFAWLMGELD